MGATLSRHWSGPMSDEPELINAMAPLWVGLLVGVAFGIPASIWGIGNPETVIRTARLIDRLLLGCFLLVTAVGSVLLYGLYAMGFAMHFSPRPVYLVGVTVGGLLFGVGAAISGYFPGTEMIALGEGRREVLFAIPGGLLGAAAWTLLYQTSLGHWLVSAANLGDLVVTGDIATIRPVPTLLVAVAYAALCLALLSFLPRYKGGRRSYLRYLTDGTTDEHDRMCARDTAAYLAEGAVDPFGSRPQRRLEHLTENWVPSANLYAKTVRVVGVLVAVVVVLSLFLRQPFGQSTTYSWVIGHLFFPDFDYSRQVFASIGWEPLTDVGVMFGALVASVLITGRFTAFRPVLPPSWRNRFGPSAGKRAVACFAGSFLVLFGARMAGGCTSGHTLSGGVQLALSAWLFTAAMLATFFTVGRLVYRDSPWQVRDA